MLWVECEDGALFNLEKTSDIRIIQNRKDNLFELRAYFPIVLTSSTGSGMDYVTIHKGSLDSCKSTLANFRVELFAKNLMFKAYK